MLLAIGVPLLPLADLSSVEGGQIQLATLQRKLSIGAK